MALCTKPIPALQTGPGQVPQLYPPLGTANLRLRCGKCWGCRQAKSQEWGLRAEHEASLWNHTAFITPTYNNEHLPPNGDLDPPELTRFIKRLRNLQIRHPDNILGDLNHGIRYLACGEYGERGERPHYHGLFYNCGFPDAKRVGTTNGHPEYKSDILDKLWTDSNGEPIGEIRFGIPDPGAAGAYVAAYTTKSRGDYYVDKDGVWHPPPFIRMSRRPIIGAKWLEKYSSDLTHGYIVQHGHQKAIPRAYRKKVDPAFADEIAGRLYKYHINNPSDRNHPDRLDAQHIIDEQQHQRRQQRRAL